MRKILLHGHMFKNAGTTLDWSLRRCFGAGFLEHRDDPRMQADAAGELRNVCANTEVIALSSHSMPSPVPALAGVQPFPIFLLRHPLRRVRSVYEFERRQHADTPGARAAKALSFADYLGWRLRDDVAPAIRNFQVRYLAGQRYRHPGTAVGERELAAAIGLVEHNPNVGVVEWYEESMAALECSLQPHFPALDLAFVAQNVAPDSRSDRAEAELAALGDIGEQLIESNALDLTLYGVACERLRASMEGGAKFLQQLASLRRRNDALREASRASGCA